MTPTETTDISTASLDSAFDDAFTDPGTANAAAPETEPASAVDPAESEAAPAEQDAVEETDGDTPAEEQPAEGQAEEEPTEPQSDEPQPSADGKGFRVSKNRMEMFTRANKFQQALADFAPTVDHARAHYQAFTDFRAMESDFLSGEPESMDRVLEFWSGSGEGVQPQHRQAYAEAFSLMADRMPNLLQKVAPQAYGNLQNRVLNERLEGMYQQAARTGDQADLYRAQSLDFALNGKYRDATQLPKHDPVAEQQKQFEARQKDFEQKVQKQHDSQWNGYHEQIESTRNTEFNNLVGEALKPAEGKFSEDEMDAFRLKIVAAVEESMKRDWEWSRNQSVDLRTIKGQFYNALKSGTRTDLKPSVDAYVSAWISKARPVISSVAGKLVSRATETKVAANKATHQRHASSQKPGTTGSGAPPKKSIAAKPTGNFESDFESAWSS